jgi:hypothetical protein
MELVQQTVGFKLENLSRRQSTFADATTALQANASTVPGHFQAHNNVINVAASIEEQRAADVSNERLRDYRQGTMRRGMAKWGCRKTQDVALQTDG